MDYGNGRLWGVEKHGSGRPLLNHDPKALGMAGKLLLMSVWL